MEAPRTRQNLFLRTKALAAGHQEDHLTEFIVAALAHSPRFAAAYVADLIEMPRPEWGALKMIEVESQVGYERNTPDMRLTLEDSSGLRRTVIVEHKIDAAETILVTQQGDAVVTEATDVNATRGDSTKERQLARYLKLPGVDGLMYFCESARGIDPEVLADGKYVRPARPNEQHYLWRDLRPLLEVDNEDSPIIGWLREAFDKLGYVQPLATIGDLNDADEDSRRRNRQNFQRLWRSAVAEARAIGWRKVEFGSISELYIEDNPASRAEWVWMNPAKGAMFVARVNLRDPRENDAFLAHCESDLLSSLREVLGEREVQAKVVRLRRQGGPRSVVDIVAPQRVITGDEEDATAIEDRLRATVISVLRATTAFVEPK